MYGSQSGADLQTDTGNLAYLAVLAYCLSQFQGEAVITRLNMPNSWSQVVRDTSRLRELESDLTEPALKRSQIFALVDGCAPEAVVGVSCVTALPLMAHRLTEYLDELRFLEPELNGRDLLDMGVPDGPTVGQVLQELRDAKLDGTVSTDGEERNLVREILTRRKDQPRG